MKEINYIVIFSMLLAICSACALSDTSDGASIQREDYNTFTSYIQKGDSITVDTVIGNFKLFYRVSEIM